MRGNGFPEGPGRLSSARRPARLSTLRQAGRRCECRAGMGGGISAVQTTQLTENWPQLTILRTRLSRSEWSQAVASSSMVHAGGTEIRVIDPNTASGSIATARRNGDRQAFPPFSAKLHVANVGIFHTIAT